MMTPEFILVVVFQGNMEVVILVEEATLEW